jgi:hypothetical protein
MPWLQAQAPAQPAGTHSRRVFKSAMLSALTLLSIARAVWPHPATYQRL